jgi:hypothetical protein
VPIPSPAGITVTGGRLNAARALAGPDAIPPAAVTDLTADTPTSYSATLHWTATGDDGATGTAAAYDVRYSTSPFGEAGFASGRYRLISGRALEVLPRLADGAYDIVFCDADRQEYPDYLIAALRLLRPGGVVAFDDALWRGRVTDDLWRERTTVRNPGDPGTAAVREMREQVRADDRLVPLLLPTGQGLLAAVRQA